MVPLVLTTTAISVPAPPPKRAVVRLPAFPEVSDLITLPLRGADDTPQVLGEPNESGPNEGHA